MSKVRGKPAVPLGDRLAEAITTLRAMAAGNAPRDVRALSGPILTYLDGKDAAKGPRFRGKPDHPIHAQLAEIETILKDDYALRERWAWWLETNRRETAMEYLGLRSFDLGIPAAPDFGE